MTSKNITLLTNLSEEEIDIIKTDHTGWYKAIVESLNNRRRNLNIESVTDHQELTALTEL